MTRASEAESAIIVLTRLPRAGRVKSRLALTLGDEAAAESYRLTAERLFAECSRLPASVARYLFYADAGDEAAIRAWVGGGFRFVPQHGAHFGRRMRNAFEVVFGEGARKAVIVGSDVPDLTAEIIAEALRLLERYPAVIGPDDGGGYYLLGLKMIYPDLFAGRLPWGTHEVYARTLRLMNGLGLVPAFLPRLIDLDVEGDLWRWLAGAPIAGHPLARYLKQLERRGANRGK